MPERPDRHDSGFTEEQDTRTPRKTATDTASGAEATKGMQGKPKGDSQTTRSSYGGEGGDPKEPKDFPQSRR